MAKNDQQEAFERLLTSSLSRNIDFLKYAEAKNAALLTFSSAWAFAIANGLNGSGYMAKLYMPYSVASLILFIGAAGTALYSFLPKRKLFKFHRDPEQIKSLVYFGDAATFDPASFIQKVKLRYLPTEGEAATQSYLDDLAVQICVNAKITDRKFTIFNVGAIVASGAFVVLLCPWSLRLLREVLG